MKKFVLPVIVFVLFISCKSNSTESEKEIFDPISEPAFDCVEGLADGQYPCENVDLYANVTLSDLRATTSANGVFVNDIWGWQDSETNKNYAIVGLVDGVTFVDITNPSEPVVVGKLKESHPANKLKFTKEYFEACMYGIGESSGFAQSKSAQVAVWRDQKVFNDHLFVVSDGQNHGMQVFDLTRLRSYDDSFLELTEDVLYDNFANAHNININEETGFAYLLGVTSADMCVVRNDSTNTLEQSGIYIIDVNNPVSPQFAGCYLDPSTDKPSSPNIAAGYIHDGQCVNYNGPDIEHQNKEICFNSAEGAIVIADVSDKDNTSTIGFSGQSTIQYSHQGWLTEDQKYFLMNDELDELNLGRGTKTYIWDVQDLDNPEFKGFFEHGSNSIDHNLYIKGDYVYQSNYRSGLRILKIEDLATASLSEVGFFDTYPENDAAAFDGAWSNYPFFDNNVVIVSDINRGLFILQPNL